jgi:GH24 family phage-related lysozyme (muramidase)
MINIKTISADDYYRMRLKFLRTVEGVKLPPYLDGVGLPTIGIGTNIGD